MTCDEAKQIVLNFGPSADQRRNATDALRHIEQCADCQRALAQYEQLQDQLKPASRDAMPVGGWDAFEQRLMDVAQPRRVAWLPQALKLAAAFLLGIAVIEALRSNPHRP